MTSILMYGKLPGEILRNNWWHIRIWVGVCKSWWMYRCTNPYNWFSYTLNYYNYWQYTLYSNGYTEVHEGCVIRNINCIGEFAKLLMGLVVLVKIMSVLINFLLQNTNLVSVLIKICPNFAGHTCIWQDWQFRELSTLLSRKYKTYCTLKGILSTKTVIFHTQNYCRFPYWPS